MVRFGIVNQVTTFIALLICAKVCDGQNSSGSLVADWIPTDLNYPFIASLRGDPLRNVSSQIAGYSTLGVITNEDVAAWLSTLINNPQARDGTVRWQPSVASKCSSGVIGCTKSIKVTVLEFQYVNPTGSDCKASALIAADAILPPQATLSDSASGSRFMPQGNPVTYQLTAAPNSTATSCTYVIQYPPATQRLANTLCSQGNTSCTDSPCLPCSANQTLTSGGSENNCLPTSGLAPALVASIEGAALCLATGGMGRFQCSVGYISNNSVCSAMGCFPGTAKVRLASGARLDMQDLKIGDKVQVVDKAGKVAYEDVYFFGHRDRTVLAPFVRLHLQASAGRGSVSKSLDISRHHFVYVRRGQEQTTAMRAKDVRVGDLLQINDDDVVRDAWVVAIESVTRQGLWNPYTLSGRIVVDDVAVSAHSEWLLDPILDYLAGTHLLPAVYQVMLWPVRALYHLMGHQAMSQLDSRFNFGKLLTSLPASWESSLTTLRNR